VEQELVKEKIRKALRLFVEKDKRELLDAMDIYEPTISHRIAVYLENLFPKFHIDCEYNKHLGHDKEISTDKKIVDQTTGGTVKIRPDIIIHKERGSDMNNLVMSEVKKAGRDSKVGKEDINKLKMVIDSSELHYSLGIFVGVLKRRIDIVWIEKNNGKVIEKPETL